MKKSWRQPAALLLIALGTVLFALPYHQIGVFDSADYLKCALKLNSGTWPLAENFYAARIAAYLPYAAGIAIGGYGKWLTYITLFELLLLLLTVYLSMAAFSRAVAILAVLLLSTSSILLTSGTAVMGDVLTALTANAVILIYLRFTARGNKNFSSAAKAGILAAAAFTISFWAKESVMFFLPLLIWLALRDRKDAVMSKFWKYVFSGIAAGGVLAVLIYWIKTGDPFFRIRYMEYQATTTDIDYDSASLATLIRRLTVQPIQFLLQDYTYGISFFLSLLFWAQPVRTAFQRHLKSYAIFILAFWWLGSQSLFHWNPMALTHRLWLPVLIPLVINGAAGACYFIQEKDYNSKERNRYAVIILLFPAAALLSLHFSNAQYQELRMPVDGLFLATGAYLAIGGLLLFKIYYQKIFSSEKMAAAILMGAIVLPQAGWQTAKLISWVKCGMPDEFLDEKEMLEALKKIRPPLILSDAMLSRNYGIYDGFREAMPFQSYLEADYDALPGGACLLLNKNREKSNAVNRVEASTFTRSKNVIPDYVIHPEKRGFRPLMENRSDVLYRLERRDESLP